MDGPAKPKFGQLSDENQDLILLELTGIVKLVMVKGSKWTHQ
jgi:hypothetical protein